MFYVNDDDTDGLFRKAAENYDINAEQAADFNSVLKVLNEEGGDDEQKPEKKRKKRFLIFWWFLLLPILGLLLWNSTLFRHNDTNNKTAILQSRDSNKESQQNNEAANDKAVAEKNDRTTASKESENNRETTGLASASASNAVSKATGGKSINNNDALLGSRLLQKSVPLPGTKSPSDPGNNIPPNKRQQLIESQPDPAAGDENKQAEKAADNIAANSITDTSKHITAMQASKDSSAMQSRSNKKAGKVKSNYFYAGLAASVDLTFIKFQKTTTPGFNAGFVTGYRFNKKWQVETGLIIDKKNYYTHGDYFDKSQVPYLNYVDLKSVTGYCNMLEIPLNARFNFGEKKNHSWFASAGISSYLMKKEYYDYGYVYNGSYNHRDYTYETTEKDWLSVMNISGGYELRTGSKSYLRFEPYYKIPLKGIGKGSLPLSSAGINVALTRSIP